MSRLFALRAIDKNWDESFVPAVKNILLHDADGTLRAQAADILAAHRVTSAIPELQSALKDRDEEVRRSAATALKNLQGNARQTIAFLEYSA